ncbi:hypothetical protein AVEN_81176-1 [Araneus ventricosus]|uniref:Uncharacterized protein n=1 Tax=Araneus ventricosus TaxID=182803 RepID=A0A4Y2UYP5_ARAVE|nr:hypothetical protein AVEN_81176-1 [Araneus ventricosus]
MLDDRTEILISVAESESATKHCSWYEPDGLWAIVETGQHCAVEHNERQCAEEETAKQAAQPHGRSVFISSFRTEKSGYGEKHHLRQKCSAAILDPPFWIEVHMRN